MEIYSISFRNGHNQLVMDEACVCFNSDGTIPHPAFEKNKDILTFHKFPEIASIWQRAFSLLEAAYHSILSFCESDPEKREFLAVKAQVNLTTFWTGTLKIFIDVLLKDGAMDAQIIGTEGEQGYIRLFTTPSKT